MLVICDHDVKHSSYGASSHGYTFARRVLISGHNVRFFAHRTCDIPKAEPVFSKTKGSFHSGFRGNSRALAKLFLLHRTILWNYSYFISLWRNIKGSDIQNLLIINVGLDNFFAILFVGLLDPRLTALVYFQSDPPRSLFVTRYFIQRLKNRISFASESAIQSEKVKITLGVQCCTIAWPVAQDHFVPAAHAREVRGDKPIRGALIGRPRAEKGFGIFVSALHELKDEILSGQVSFFVQIDSTSYELSRDTERLKMLLSSCAGCNISDSPLSSDDYEKQMWNADFIILPYLSSAYNLRSSGILYEALSYGKPVVITDALHMSGEAVNSKAGIGFVEDEPSSLAAAIREMSRCYRVYESQAVELSKIVRYRHSIPVFLEDCEKLLSCGGGEGGI